MTASIYDISKTFKPFAYPGKLITVVGFDGSGKTTQLDLLERTLQQEGHTVHNWKQPTDWYRGLGGVKVFHNEGGSATQAKVLSLLAAADRQKHVEEEILPALRQGHVVLVDRYVYATFGVFVHRGVDLDFLININAGIPKPDLAFYLRLTPQQLASRLKARDGDNLQFEERDLSRVASIISTYEKMPQELISIDGSRSVNDVAAEVNSHINKSCSGFRRNLADFAQSGAQKPI